MTAFLHGVASGDPTSRRVVIWTRVSGATGTAPVGVRWRVFAVEFVNTSLTSQNLEDKMDWQPRTDSVAIETAVLAAMPHIRFLDLDSHGYSIVEVDRDQVRFEWWTVEGLAQRAPGQAMEASMTVRHGAPRLIPGT